MRDARLIAAALVDREAENMSDLTADAADRYGEAVMTEAFRRIQARLRGSDV